MARCADDQCHGIRHLGGDAGSSAKVIYECGEAEVIIAIVTYVPGDATLLKPGAAIFCVAPRKADGSLTASRITAEKDGIKPPM